MGASAGIEMVSGPLDLAAMEPRDDDWILPTPQTPMRCLGCGYDLIGLPAGVCPECARAFDPEDASTWAPRSVARWRRAMTSRWVGYVAISLVLVGAMWATVIPRPFVSWDGKPDPMLWVWFDRPFGIERRRASSRLDLTWWNGRLSGVRERPQAVGPGGTLVGSSWDLQRRGDHWRLRAGAGTPASAILLAFNSMRTNDELFGVAIVDEEGQELESPGRIARSGPNPTSRRAEQAFEADGRQEEILAAVLAAYGFRIRSSLITPDDEDLWVFDAERVVLERISVGEARERGVEFDVLDSMRVQRFRWP